MSDDVKNVAPDRPAWAQGPEWEEWETVHSNCVKISTKHGTAFMHMLSGRPELSGYSGCFPYGTYRNRNSVNALRIYAEGLLRLEAELEAAE